MIIAICIFCGARKVGAFGDCAKCGVGPESDEELAASLGLTDHYIDADGLDSIAIDISNGQTIDLTNFDDNAQAKLLESVKSETFKRMSGIFSQRQNSSPRAVCIVCGSIKKGVWGVCRICNFKPETVLELVTAQALSAEGQYRSKLSEMPQFIRRQKTALELGEEKYTVDMSIIPQVLNALRDPSFRDPFTLTRAAKDKFFSKQLNLHEIGPDRYKATVLTRGEHLQAPTFDAVRRAGDGDMYAVVVYEKGKRNQHIVSKDKWYAAYDMMMLTERELLERSPLNKMYDGLCKFYIERYLTTGRIE